MKKTYEEPKIGFVVLEARDMISSSGGIGNELPDELSPFNIPF